MKKIINIFLSIFVLVIPTNIFAAQIESPGTYNIPSTTSATDYLIEYDLADSTTKQIIANISSPGTYSYTKSNGGLGIINIGSYNNAILNTTVNGNLEFIRTSSNENDVYGLEVYSKSNLTLNGSFVTEQNTNHSDNHYTYIYGLTAEAESNITIKDNVTINKISGIAPNSPHAQAIGIVATSEDGSTGGAGGKSTVTIGTDNSNICIIKNIISESNTKASSFAITANGEATNPTESTININSSLTIDTVTSTSNDSESYGINSTVLGKTNINGDLLIQNITAQSNNAYAVGANYGGETNINTSKDKTIKINGDILSVNCFNDENDKAKVSINITNSNSYLKGATITDDDSDDKIYGDINLNILNNATWNVINRTRTDTLKKQNLSQVTNLSLDDATIDMYNNEYSNQNIEVKNSNNLNGTLIINTDVKNTTGTNTTDYVYIENENGTSQIKVNAYDTNIKTLNNEKYKQWFATTPNENIAFIPGEVIIDGITYHPIIEKDNKISGSEKTDWYIVGYTTEDEITITFDSNGGSYIDPIITGKGNKTELNEAPTKNGYKFEGWYTDKELTNKVTEISPEEDITVYAKWKKTNTFDPSNPTTADIIITWVITATISLAVLVILIIAIIKNKKNKDDKNIENKTNKKAEK